MCRSLREAVSLTIEKHSTLAISGWARSPGRLDSKLLLGWASSGSWGLVLTGSSCSAPGLISFLQAAAPVQHIDVLCDSLLAAACADTVLSHATGLESLWCSGEHTPTVLPRSLQQVKVRLHDSNLQAADKQMDAFLYRLSFLPCLDCLELYLGPRTVLASPRWLPSMRHMMLSFTVVDGAPLDFLWLHVQPIKDLVLRITLQAQEPAQQVRLIDHLLPLGVKRLTIDLQVPLAAEAQQRWAQLAVLGDLLIYLPAQGMHLSHLPCCRECCISGLAGGARMPVTVDYAALGRYAGKYSINGYQHQSIMVLGFSGHVPQYAEPWQISSSTPPMVGGLPGIEGQPQDSNYKLQNVAADEAGW